MLNNSFLNWACLSLLFLLTPQAKPPKPAATQETPYQNYLKKGRQDPAWDSLVGQAVQEYDARRYASARRVFEQAVERGCDNGFILYYLADCILQQFKTNVPGPVDWYAQAARCYKLSYEDLVKKDPKNYWTWRSAASYSILTDVVFQKPDSAREAILPFRKNYEHWLHTGIHYTFFAQHFFQREVLVKTAWERAIECFQKAAELDPKAADPHIEMGVAYYRLRKTREGKEHFQKALDLGNDFVTLLAQAKAHKERSEYAAALHYQSRLCRKLEESKSPELYYALFHQAVTWFLLDHYDQAEQGMKHAQELAPKDMPLIRRVEFLQWQAELYRIKNDSAKELETNLNVWELVRENRMPESVDTTKVDVVLQQIIYGYTRLKQFDRAEAYLKEYQNVFPLKDPGTYPDFARAHIQLARGRVAEAFEGFRRCHQTLVDQVKLNQHLGADGVTDLNSYQQYDRKLSNVQKMIELAIEHNQNDLAWEWLQFYKRLRFSQLLLEAGQTRQVRDLTQEEVRQTLMPDETMLEYLVTPSRTHAWIITRDKTELITMNIGEETLTRMVKAFRTHLQDPLSNDWKKDARDLHERIFKPLLPSLGHRKLIIAPSKALYFVPFQALLDDREKFLLESREISVIPGAGVLAFCRERPWESGNAYLGLGNPRIDESARQELSLTRNPDSQLPLPFSEKEIRATAALFPQSMASAGKDATESFFNTHASSSQWIHLACHAEINLFDPTYSTFYLTGDSREDGRLEAHEISRLDLSRTNLAVLNACQSGLGNLDRGDHITGLADAFMAAGVPVIAATLWNVDDESTARIAMEFFTRIVKNADPALAMSEAQKIALAQKRHPYYWAGWVLLGAQGARKPLSPEPGRMDRIDHAGERFDIDRYEVANREYARFMEAGGYEKKEFWTEAGWDWKTKNKIVRPAYWDRPGYRQPLQPVVGVSWYEASAYAAWAGKSLPTVNQWMTAFIGDRKKLEIDNSRTNLGDSGYKDGYRFTAPVGNFESDKGPWGTQDMIGNVSEWCAEPAKKGSLVVAPVSGDHFDEFNRHNDITLYVAVTDRPAWIGFRCARPVQ